MGFGAAVRARRKELGLTLEDLSERAEVTPNYLGKIENGRAEPSLPIAAAIAGALLVGIDALLDDPSRNRVEAPVLDQEAMDLVRLHHVLPPAARRALRELLLSLVPKAVKRQPRGGNPARPASKAAGARRPGTPKKA